MSKLLSIKCNQNPVGHHGNICAPFFIQNMSQIHAMSKGSDRILDWKNWKAEKILMQAVSRQKELISKNNNSGWWYHLNVVTWLLSDQTNQPDPKSCFSLCLFGNLSSTWEFPWECIYGYDRWQHTRGFMRERYYLRDQKLKSTCKC